MKPAAQPNSHEISFRETVYNGDTNTTTTREVWVGVPKFIGETSSRLKIDRPTGVMVDAQTSTTKNTAGSVGLSALGTAGGFIAGRGM